MGEVQRKVRVDLGRNSYDIVIGRKLQKELAEFVSQAGFSQKGLVLTDEHVGALYGEAVCGWLQEAGMEAVLVRVPAGESSKSLGTAEQVFTACIKAGLDLEMPGDTVVCRRDILDAVANGSLTEDELDAACRNILKWIQDFEAFQPRNRMCF